MSRLHTVRIGWMIPAAVLRLGLALVGAATALWLTDVHLWKVLLVVAGLAAAAVPRTPAPWVLVLLIGVALLLSWFAVGICGEAERRLGKRDPGCVVFDEFAVIPLCFLGWQELAAIVPSPWAIFAAGFALFRLLDIRKPFGISALQELPGNVAPDAFSQEREQVSASWQKWLMA